MPMPGMIPEVTPPGSKPVAPGSQPASGNAPAFGKKPVGKKSASGKRAMKGKPFGGRAMTGKR